MQTGLTKDEVIWTKDLSRWSSSHRIHCSRLKIH